jgi:hypothetical protein
LENSITTGLAALPSRNTLSALSAPAGFHADNRINLGIIRSLAIEDFNSEKIFLDLIAAPREHTLHREAQEPTLALSMRKAGTR